MAESECAYLCFAILTICGLFVVVGIHLLAWFPVAVERGVFRHTQRENWAFYDLDIVYDEWILATWIIIYALQVLWVVYSLIALCRETKYGSLVMNPPIMPSTLFITYLPGLAATVGWVVMFDWREYSAYSSVLMMAATVFMCITMALTLHALKVYEEEAKAEGFLADVWAVRIVVQNGISVFASWAAAMTCYSVAIVMYGFELLPKDVAQYAALGVMMAYLLIWTGLDLFVTQYLTHFVLGPYIVFFVVFLQPFLMYWSELSTFFVLGTVFLGFTILLFSLKIIIMLGRCCCKSARRSVIDEAEFGAVEYVPSSEEESNATHSPQLSLKFGKDESEHILAYTGAPY